MSDERRRRAERDAAGDGGDEAAARDLIERLRSGELTRERVALAAYLGDRASCLALDAGPRAEVVTPGAWARGLAAFGREAEVRAAIAVAWVVLPEWEGDEVSEWVAGRRALVRAAIEAAEAWVLEPTPEAEHRAEQASSSARLACMFEPHSERAKTAGLIGAMAAHATSSVVVEHDAATTHYASACVDLTAGLVGRRHAEAAVAREVVPWALGRRDPVRQRAEARGASPA